ncbi:MAG: malonate--CoA ligase [Burkholderiaceae bacterium]
MNHNLFAAFEAAFPKDSGACAVETQDGRYFTWADLDRASAKIANLLASLKLRPGSRVAVQVDKSVENMLLYLAVLRAGYVYLPLNNAYQSAELAYFLDNAQPAVIVCAPAQRAMFVPLAQSCGAKNLFTLGESAEGTLIEQAAAMADRFKTVQRVADDLAAILYTSGTTGRSKGAMLSHGNMLSNAQTLHAYWGWSASDVLLHALPIFHVHGLFVAIHGALMAGAKMLWMNKFDASVAVELLPRATVFMGVPTLYVRLLAEPSLSKQSTQNMRLFISGSAPLLVDTHQQFYARTGHTILERYGMSETVMLTSNPYHGDARLVRRAGTVGPPLPGVQVRVVNDDGSVCAVDEVGGIQVKGPNVFSGYWKMPEKTREEFTADGFFKTGDVGKFDVQGYLSIVGRSKDLIITGGYNVYPKEIEGYLDALPGVAESAVIGVPHPDFGEAVCAVVTARDGATLLADALIDALKTSIANFKVPKRVWLAAELPRNAMGKVQKNVLREQYKSTFSQ